MSALFVEKGWIVAPFLLALLFAFSNGFRDSSTIVATVVSTRVLTPGTAFFLCAVFEFLGAFFLGSAIVATVSGRLFHDASSVEMAMVLSAALSAAILWGAISSWRAWPTANNQALIAGLFGSGLAAWGHAYLANPILPLIVVVLVVSPIIGFLVALAITSTFFRLAEWLTPRARPFVDAAHVLGCLAVSAAHGSNGSQLIVGILASALGAGAVGWFGDGEGGHISARLVVAVALSTGMMFGGRRILAKLGLKFYRIRPPQGVVAQGAAAATILACTLTGFPTSATQVIAGSILGAGVANNPRAVRWHIVQDIVLAWLYTLPAVFVMSFLICSALLRMVR